MSSNTFVGDKLVGELPSQATQQLSNEELTKQEAQRLKEGASEPGANKRAGVASRDPAGECCCPTLAGFDTVNSELVLKRCSSL